MIINKKNRKYKIENIKYNIFYKKIINYIFFVKICMYQLKLNVDFIIIILENKIMENVIMRKIEDILNKLLVQLFNDILQIEEKSLKNTQFTDLSITEIHTIEAIGLDRSRTMGEIAHDLRITVGTLTTAITKLIKKGYVERKRIEEDRRVVLVNLTSKGEEVYKVHQVFHEEMICAMLSNFSDEEEQVLSKSLEKLNTFFEEKYKSFQ